MQQQVNHFPSNNNQLFLTCAVENTEGQHQSYRRGYQGEHLIKEAVDDILLGC
jgi:hypothetical protein